MMYISYIRLATILVSLLSRVVIHLCVCTYPLLQVLGSIFEGDSGVFKKEHLNRMKSDIPFLSDPGPHSCIISFIDPAGGGASNTAICTIMRTTNDTLVIMGVADANVNTEMEICQFISEYFTAFGEASIHITPPNIMPPHYLLVESNYGGAFLADVIFRRAQRSLPSLKEYRSKRLLAGVVTTNDIKYKAVVDIIWNLHQNKIKIFAKCVSSPATDTKRALCELYSQLGNFRRSYTQNMTAVFNGKIGGTSRDDIAIAFLLASYHGLIIKTQLFLA
jgi:hypothetical protein